MHFFKRHFAGALPPFTMGKMKASAPVGGIRTGGP